MITLPQTSEVTSFYGLKNQKFIDKSEDNFEKKANINWFESIFYLKLCFSNKFKINNFFHQLLRFDYQNNNETRILFFSKTWEYKWAACSTLNFWWYECKWKIYFELFQKLAPLLQLQHFGWKFSKISFFSDFSSMKFLKIYCKAIQYDCLHNYFHFILIFYRARQTLIIFTAQF